jgi:hypothetical protein
LRGCLSEVWDIFRDEFFAGLRNYPNSLLDLAPRDSFILSPEVTWSKLIEGLKAGTPNGFWREEGVGGLEEKVG